MCILSETDGVYHDLQLFCPGIFLFLFFQTMLILSARFHVSSCGLGLS